jgi:hypothetical protein
VSPAPKYSGQPNYRPCCAEGPDEGDPRMIRKRPMQKDAGDRRGQGGHRQHPDDEDGALGPGHHMILLHGSSRINCSVPSGRSHPAVKKHGLDKWNSVAARA